MVNQANDNPKTVLVTGGARRIGACIVREFHVKGYNVIIHYNKSEDEAKELADELNDIRNNSVLVVKANLSDFSDPKLAASFVDKVTKFKGRLDCLVNNASSFFPTQFGEVSLEQWRDLMISNTGGPFFLAQAVAPVIEKSNGVIINISDIHAQKPLKNYSVYSIAKAANDMMTKTLARELAPGIRVNAVAPGPVMWPEDKNTLTDEQKNNILNRTLLKKAGNSKDIAKAVYFLATSDYITGQILAVDGGRSIKG